jgi:hypothetical protein
MMKLWEALLSLGTKAKRATEKKATTAEIARPEPVTVAPVVPPASAPAEKRVAAKRVEPECDHDFRPIGGALGNEKRCQKCGHQPGLVRKRQSGRVIEDLKNPLVR